MKNNTVEKSQHSIWDAAAFIEKVICNGTQNSFVSKTVKLENDVIEVKILPYLSFMRSI